MTKTVKARTLELCGSNYEIGRTLGSIVTACPPLLAAYTAGMEGFGPEEVRAAREIFHRWCPGLNEELAGFADAVHAAPERILYYAMTYLRPNCSHLALLPSRTSNGHPLLARNYEFCDEMEDFMLIKTNVNGKYSHMGTGVLNFGRDDGFNECGLALTMSSCGFPVGALKEMRSPMLHGLQFWAVTRSVLENCKNVEEALQFLKEMPIAYNLNLILLDKSGASALLETLDGRKALKQIDPTSPGPYLYATNHPVLKELAAIEPMAMSHSLKREEYIKKCLASRPIFSPDMLKAMLLSPYPDGLCCHAYSGFFGTTKSMLIDPVDGTIDLCWGGQTENGWHTYRLAEPLGYSEMEVTLTNEPVSQDMFQFVPIQV